MVLWFYLQALLGNGAHLFSAVHRNQRDVEEQMIFFKLSLSGFKVWAQSDSAQIDQPWSKTVHGQECCKFFSFVRIKVFHGKGLGFWRFFFFFTGIVKWIFLVLVLVEQFTALKLCCIFNCSSCCPTGQKLWSMLSSHAFVPCPQTPWAAHDPHSSSISWRCLLEKEQMFQLGPKQCIPLGELLDPALPWGRKLRQRATSQKAQQDSSLPKILHVPLQVWAGLKKNLGLWLESDGWFEAHSPENDN